MMNSYASLGRLNLLYYLIFLPLNFYVIPNDGGGVTHPSQTHPSQTHPPQTSSVYIHPSKRRRPGKQPRPLHDRTPAKSAPRGAPRRSYTREKKLQVLQWLQDPKNFRVPAGQPANRRTRKGLTWIGDARPPTDSEAEEQWKIDGKLIAKWWRQQACILNQPVGTRADHRDVQLSHWPRLEHDLYGLFVAARSKGQPIGQGWFKREASKLFTKHYQSNAASFRASRGWLYRFCKRWYISRRRVTKQATKTLEQDYSMINSFLCFIRRVSWGQWGQNRFTPDRIINMDETPIPFEYLDGYSYDFKGAKTITTKTIRSGWGKRQATLILYIFADGIKRLPPKLIFHGSEDSSLINNRESAQYDQRVTWEYNKKAYNNEKLMMKWLEEEITQFVSNRQPLLMVLDQASFHRTPKVLQWFRDHLITCAIVPSGCTSLIQPLDTAINKAFKALLQRHTEDLTAESSHHATDLSNWTISERRILTTKAVAMAWEELNPQLVTKSFVECGINIDPRGYNDKSVKIKDLPDVSWAGWDSEYTIAEDPATKLEVYDNEDLDEADDGDQFECADGADGQPWSPEEIYLNMNKKQLFELLKARKLPRSGKKSVLLATLVADDQAARNRRQGRSRRKAVVIYEDSHDPPVAPMAVATPGVQKISLDSLINKENMSSFDSQYYSQ